MTNSQTSRANNYQTFGSKNMISIMEHNQEDPNSYSVWSHEEGDYIANARGELRFSQRDARDLALEYAV
jgi:hypothetical protein